MTTDNNFFPRTLNIGILVFEDFEPLDVWGFIEAFSISRFIGTDYNTTNPVPFKISFIANEDSNHVTDKNSFSVKSYNGPRVLPDFFRDEALAHPFDLLMVPGGKGVRTILSSLNKTTPQDEVKASSSLTELVNWLVQMDKKVSVMSSVCTGAALLAYAGLLNGKSATTNHQAFPWVVSFGPHVLWNNISRWVDAGKYVTSAGVSAGTDMAFHLVTRLAGRAVAETAVLAAEYDWQRNPNHPIYYPPQAKVPSSFPS